VIELYAPKDSSNNSNAGAGGTQQRKEPQEDNSRKSLRENVMRVALTSEARQRLANVRMVKPQLAQTIEDYIFQMASTGKLRRVINDDELKEMLGQLQEKKRDFTIRRI
jgi:programmed cell death protein 5